MLSGKKENVSLNWTLLSETLMRQMWKQFIATECGACKQSLNKTDAGSDQQAVSVHCISQGYPGK